MKYWRFIAIGLAVIFLLYYYFAVYPDGRKGREQAAQTSQEQNAKQWETKTDEPPPVSIKITPTEFGKDAKLWKFTVVFTAHSGDLDQDPTKVAVLVDDKGSVYQPVSWEGPGPGGHHREGALIFNSINPIPKYVELKIKDVGGVPERSFRWNLE